MNKNFFFNNTAKGIRVWSGVVPELGAFELRTLDPDKDIPLIHDWVNKDYARYWGMNGRSIAFVKEEYDRICNSGYSNAFAGTINGQTAFLCECYDPAKDIVGEHYNVQPGDIGMHVLIAPAEKRVHGFTWHVFTAIMDFLFSDSGVNRVVVEPDINNEKIHKLNKRAGFEYHKVISLPNKKAGLAFCTREQYRAAIKNAIHSNQTFQKSDMRSPDQVVTHLQPEIWAKANRMHVCKIISEFAHERLIQPGLVSDTDGWGHYRLVPPGNTEIVYQFSAQLLSLNHWYIARNTVRKLVNGAPAPLDSVQFILEFNSELKITEEQLPLYMEEITSTLNGLAFTLSGGQLSAEELAQAGYQDIEHAMTSGHPCFVANNGRIGFDANDYRDFAPEADQPVKLLWLAGHKSRTAYSAVEELPYRTLLEKELGRPTLSSFEKVLAEKGLSPEDYFFIPVHPWQWYNRLAIVFAADIANNHLVCLGYSPDEYKAQQSIRTFYNISNPEKHYTKTALAILNMGFVRGLTPYYMDSTPPITSWIKQAIGGDPYLQQLGFTLLCEVATVGYRNLNYEQFGKHSPYNKMLASLWRESPATVLQPGQQLMTMAALLHTDRDGNALLPALIKASGKSTAAWLRQYLRSYLTPLLHCFYQHNLVFMPHGENLILVMEDHVPVKVIMKDITEEIGVFGMNPDIPEKGRRICVEVPEELRILSILTDVFDCFFRFVTQVLVEHCNYSDKQFWKLVAECVHDYQQDHPEMAERFERYDMFMPEFTLSCLNRLQLRNNRQMVDLADPAGSLQFAGTLRNPIAPYRKLEKQEEALLLKSE